MGRYHSCGVDGAGQAVCWGCESEVVDRAQCDAPSGTYTGITADAMHSCAVDSAGDIVCWGSDSAGQGAAP